MATGSKSSKKRSYLDYLSTATAKIPRESYSRYQRQILPLQDEEGETLVESIPSDLDIIYDTLAGLNEDARLTLNSNEEERVDVAIENEGIAEMLNVMEEIEFFHRGDEEIDMNATEFLFDDYDRTSGFQFEDGINVESLAEDAVGEEPLFDGSRIKVAEFVLLILTFASHCHITGTALRLLLKIIELICPKENRCKASMKEIFSFVKSLDVPLRCHYFCTTCYFYRGTEKKNQPCPVCQKFDVGYFIDIPMLGELRKISERLWHHMDYRFKKDPEEGIIRDVYDGNMYKQHFNDPDGFLRDQNNISLIGFTDGVSIFKSSGFSVWPVYFCINELPPKLRFRRENGVFAGLWFGKIKPHFPTFFKPFAETIWDLYENGMEIVTSDGVRHIRALFLQMTCDAPAKCLFQNFKQFNGKYGCPYCLHPGESCLHTGEQITRSFIYDFRDGDEAPDRRDHKNTRLHAEEAHKNKIQGKTQFDVFGVKGHSWALYLPHFNIIDSVCLDYMHAVLLGVTKQLMTLWFNATYKNCDWSCYAKLKQVQGRLLNIKPTNTITRVPRSLEELHHWKASEFRAWLLFYGQPCMFGILKEAYFQHFLLLVESVWLLLQERIFLMDVEQAERNLKYFCYQLKCLYGTRTLTFNMHQLLHLTQSVLNHGPLWTHSCFHFEDYNGQLRHFFHGTQNVEVQVLRTVAVIQSLPEIAKKLEPGSQIHAIYSVLTGSRPVLRSIEKIQDNIYAVGKMVAVDLQAEKQLNRHLIAAFPHFRGHVFQFQRLLHLGDMIHSKSYQRVAQRNSYTVQYNNQYGLIQSFYRLSDGCLCNTLNCYCEKKTAFYAGVLNLPIKIIGFVTDSLTGLSMTHCKPVGKPDLSSLEFVEVSRIVQKVLYADFDQTFDYSFVINFPNHIEKD